MKGIKFETIDVRLPVFIVRTIDKLVKEGRFKDRNDFFAYAVQKVLMDLEVKPEITKEEFREILDNELVVASEEEISQILRVLKEG